MPTSKLGHFHFCQVKKKFIQQIIRFRKLSFIYGQMVISHFTKLFTVYLVQRTSYSFLLNVGCSAFFLWFTLLYFYYREICSMFCLIFECWKFMCECVYWFLCFCRFLTCRQLNVALVLPFICVNNVCLIWYAAFACNAQSLILSLTHSFVRSRPVIIIIVVSELTQSNAENDIWKGLQVYENHLCWLLATCCIERKFSAEFAHWTSSLLVQHLQNTEKMT